MFIDDSGNPRLADFGLATVVGDPELQWGPSTAGSNFNPQWRAPEVIGINGDPELPTFESDIYSFGSVMLFVRSRGPSYSYILSVPLSGGFGRCAMET